MGHRFSDARHYLAQAELGGAPAADVQRLRLNIDQACGANLDAVLDERREIAAKSVAIGQTSWRLVRCWRICVSLPTPTMFTARRCVNTRTFRHLPWRGFAFSSACFGANLRSEPKLALAEQWYRKAIACLPCYVKARVHLAEILSGDGRTKEAEALLTPALASGDPEVRWRLADVLAAQGRHAEADAELDAARSGSRLFWRRHLLAFADHGAEFYAGSGNDAHEPSNWRASTSTTVQRFVPSNRHTRSPSRPGKRRRPLKFLQQAPSAGGTLPHSGCRLWHHRESPHDRSSSFRRWHGARRRCSGLPVVAVGCCCAAWRT